MWIGWILAALWTIGCGLGAHRLYGIKRSGEFLSEHLLNGVALLLLTMAPYTSLLVYQYTPVDHIWMGAGQLLGALLVFGIARRFRFQRLNPDSKEASMTSFREKSAILMFGALVVLTIGALLFIVNFGLSSVVPVVIASVVLLTVIAIVGHIAIALLQYPMEEVDTPADERDREVELSSIRNSYYVIGFGIWVIPVIAVTDYPGFVVALVSCALILAAELMYYGSMVRYYRVGVA